MRSGAPSRVKPAAMLKGVRRSATDQDKRLDWDSQEPRHRSAAERRNPLGNGARQDLQTKSPYCRRISYILSPISRAQAFSFMPKTAVPPLRGGLAFVGRAGLSDAAIRQPWLRRDPIQGRAARDMPISDSQAELPKASARCSSPSPTESRRRTFRSSLA